jgi:hypothetical protein
MQLPMKISFMILMITMILVSCSPVEPDYNFKYEIVVTDSATNLQNLNSENDDFNSALPYPAARSEIYFSTNRNNNGDNYDIICRSIDISYHKSDDVLNFSIPTNTVTSPYETSLLNLINTQHDELGPFVFGTNGWNYFFYANNESGNFDIKFVYTTNLDWGTYDGQRRLFGPTGINSVNSAFDDLYPTINQDKSKLLFCSNRENSSFDIYSINLNSEKLLHDYLISENIEAVIKESVLSSNSNDKCPSINGDIIVFASDWKGGFGGYDLYYSKFINNQWGAPVNFGGKVNSSSDEYRPITFSFFNYFDIMIFSSNRPGGKGGYDLYSVKINDLIK